MRTIDLEAERKFENLKVLDGNVRARQSKYYWATHLPTHEHQNNTLKAIAGAAVLEIGCSRGQDAIHYADACDLYIGIDISDEAIRNASDLGLQNAEFIWTDGHELPFEDGKFDYVIVNSLLHHLDLEVSFSEIGRVLKDDGELVFREPLGTNPVFQFYRWLTPAARTADERPFTFSDLALMRKYFIFRDVRWFGFLSIASAFFRAEVVRSILTGIDDILARTPAKYFYWQFCGFAKKR